jgi:hypothetical protein
MNLNTRRFCCHLPLLSALALARSGRLFAQGLSLVTAIVVMQPCRLAAQRSSEPFWIAGRYDGNRVIIYFDAVKFNKSVPRNARRITLPASPFFPPIELPPNYIAEFFKAPGAFRFALGDAFDVLTGGDAISVKLTSLVGTEGDEEVGNSSYIGALASVIGECPLLVGTEFYAVRTHREPVCGTESTPGHPVRVPTHFATLVNDPVRFDIQAHIVALLIERMRSIASGLKREAAEGRSPAFAVQPFRVSDGSLRYYATAQWKSDSTSAQSNFTLGAWLAATPTLRILAVEADQYFDLHILNVANLGGGRTGIILATQGEDSISTDLIEYRDGSDATHMRHLQSIAAAE